MNIFLTLSQSCILYSFTKNYTKSKEWGKYNINF
jgi:hypothetical protein